MKTWKKFGALLCAATLALALTACNEEDVGQILADAELKVTEATSLQADMVMDMDMTIAAEGKSQTMKMNTQMEMQMFNDPIKMKMDMTTSVDMSEMLGADGVQEMTTQAYMVGENNVYTMYSNDGTAWNSQKIDMSTMEQYDPSVKMSLCLKNGDSFKAAGEESIDGTKAKKYKGFISNEALNEVMQASGVVNGMGSIVNMEGLDWAALYKDMGNIPITLWIDGEGYPVRYEMDMTEMMNKLYGKIIEQFGEAAAGAEMNCEKVLVTMDCYNYNKAEDFSVPTEAMS